MKLRNQAARSAYMRKGGRHKDKTRERRQDVRQRLRKAPESFPVARIG